MRLFIACDLSQAQKHELETVQHKLSHYLSGVRWVKPQGLHLTLSFLGETDEIMLKSIKTVLDKVAAAASPFTVKLGGCGVFPNPSKARVLWIGIGEGERALQQIKKMIDYNLSELGFDTENRPYKPHLTLGRMRYPVEEKLIRRFLDQYEGFSSTPAHVTTLKLYESRLTAGGAYYYPQAEVDFKIRT